MSKGKWIGVDLDGTLAKYDGWISPTSIGEPVIPMVHRVQGWLSQGIEVRILTARMSPTTERYVPEVKAAIEKWCKIHIGAVLPVTCIKDHGMIELWDDRAIQVVPNKGIPITQNYEMAIR